MYRSITVMKPKTYRQRNIYNLQFTVYMGEKHFFIVNQVYIDNNIFRFVKNKNIVNSIKTYSRVDVPEPNAFVLCTATAG